MRRIFCALLLAGLHGVVTSSAEAQFFPNFKLFKSNKSEPAPQPVQQPLQQPVRHPVRQPVAGTMPTQIVQAQPESSQRILEVLVELAWIEDPATFPYIMEARVLGAVLQIRGNVPNRQIHEHALKVAQLHCPLALVDHLKENPNLQARPRRMSPSQLYAAAQTSLREALPRHHQYIKVKVNAEGRIAVTGSVPTFEHKLSVSQSLRRLHGCTAVSNLLEVASDPGGHLARQALAKGSPVQNTSGVLTSNPGQGKNPVQAQPTSIQGQQPGQPGQGVVIMPAPMGNGQPVSQAQLRQRIEQAAKGARGVQVRFTSATEVRVEVTVNRVEDGDQVVGQIFSLQELQPYRVDMHVQVQEPTNK